MRRIVAASVVLGVVVLGGSPASAAQHTPLRHHYTVRAGDTLWGISWRFYGTHREWRLLAAVNGVADPRLLPVGDRLRLPHYVVRFEP